VNQNDLAIATGGISAPLWLPAMNQWIALVLGIMSIVYVGFKIYQMWKDR
jgi:hypothetical protein